MYMFAPLNLDDMDTYSNYYYYFPSKSYSVFLIQFTDSSYLMLGSN